MSLTVTFPWTAALSGDATSPGPDSVPPKPLAGLRFGQPKATKSGSPRAHVDDCPYGPPTHETGARLVGAFWMGAPTVHIKRERRPPDFSQL